MTTPCSYMYKRSSRITQIPRSYEYSYIPWHSSYEHQVKVYSVYRLFLHMFTTSSSGSATYLGECFEKLIVLSLHNLSLSLVVPWIRVCTGVAWVMLHVFYVSALGSWVSSFRLRPLYSGGGSPRYPATGRKKAQKSVCTWWQRKSSLVTYIPAGNLSQVVQPLASNFRLIYPGSYNDSQVNYTFNINISPFVTVFIFLGVNLARNDYILPDFSKCGPV
jgi:hypothetical protein